MRIWSLHPKYLDSKGLVALWRETLLAKHVLQNKTKGYKNHPQLTRFKNCKCSIDAINQYLVTIYEEAVLRGYNFDKTKIDFEFKHGLLNVTNAQLNYEVEHLLKKLKGRDIEKYKKIATLKFFKPHPLFKIIKGDIENWEIVEKK